MTSCDILLLILSCSGTNERDAGSAPWPFPEKRAVSIVRDVARALSFMHDKQYTHRYFVAA
jgi:serine/threonine protein kinase